MVKLGGVPQDSVLGPLFNIYVNDMPIAVNSSILQFANDLKMFKRVIKGAQELQNGIDKLLVWANCNLLVWVNCNKWQPR